MTSQHDAPKLIFPISACRCAGKMILLCCYETMGCWIRKCCQFCICMMTSRHDVKNRLYSISACRSAREMIFFVSIVFGSPSLEMLSFWCLHDVMTSWRDVMTSQNSFLLDQLVDVLKWWYTCISVDISVEGFQTIMVYVYAWCLHVITWSLPVYTWLFGLLNHKMLLFNQEMS